MSDKIFNWTANWIKKRKLLLFQSRIAPTSNDQAKKHAFKGLCSPAVFLALKQSHGRGGSEGSSKIEGGEGSSRRDGGRKWHDSDLMLSVLWEKDLKELEEKSPEGFSKDCLTALKTAFPLVNPKFKAPNDLYLEEKKLAGVLIEFLSQGENSALIVGLGLNVFSHPKDIPSSCLTDQTKDIHPKNWGLFLNHLFALWSKRASFAHLGQSFKGLAE